MKIPDTTLLRVKRPALRALACSGALLLASLPPSSAAEPPTGAESPHQADIEVLRSLLTPLGWQVESDADDSIVLTVQQKQTPPEEKASEPATAGSAIHLLIMALSGAGWSAEANTQGELLLSQSNAAPSSDAAAASVAPQPEGGDGIAETEDRCADTGAGCPAAAPASVDIEVLRSLLTPHGWRVNSDASGAIILSGQPQPAPPEETPPVETPQAQNPSESAPRADSMDSLLTALSAAGWSAEQDDEGSLLLSRPDAEPSSEPLQAAVVTEPADTDGDGIDDAADRCPDTAADQEVDTAGCPVATPLLADIATLRALLAPHGWEVNSDASGSIILSGQPQPASPEQSPEQPATTQEPSESAKSDSMNSLIAALSAAGWSAQQDTDGSLLLSRPDAAPSSEPLRAAVVTEPADTDGDGIDDAADRCPDSAADQEVDTAGCPVATPLLTDIETLRALLAPHGWRVSSDANGAVILSGQPKPAKPAPAEEKTDESAAKVSAMHSLITALSTAGWSARPDVEGNLLLSPPAAEPASATVEESTAATSPLKPTGKAPTEAAPTEAAPTEAAPTEEAPTEAAPTEAAPDEAVPTEEAPTEPAPTEATPAEEAPTEPVPTEAAPTEEAPTEATPTEEAPAQTAEPTPAPVAATPEPEPVDTDADGVADSKDLCPGTEANIAVNAAGCAAATPVALEDVTFASGSAKLNQRAKQSLQQQAEILRQLPDLEFTVVGHTDSVGRASYNKRLSQRRARSVRDYLVSQGVSGDHLKSAGRGEEAPVASNATPAGRAKNRRVELEIKTR